MMLERTVYAILSSGFGYLKEKASSGDFDDITSLFLSMGLPSSEVAKVATYLTLDDGFPDILLGYPRHEQRFPLLAVVLSGDSPSQKFVGNVVTFTDEQNNGESREGRGQVFSVNVTVIIYAKHPDVCAYLYHLAKWCFFTFEDVLDEDEWYDVSLSGNELAPDPQFSPAGLFGRRLTVSAQRMYLQRLPADKIQVVRSIRGLSWDSDPSVGAPGEDTGNPVSKISVYEDTTNADDE